jgi:hypothetical protein
MHTPEQHTNRLPTQHPSPPLTHVRLGLRVCPRIHEHPRHRLMPLASSVMQRRASSLRRAPPRQSAPDPCVAPPTPGAAPLCSRTTIPIFPSSDSPPTWPPCPPQHPRAPAPPPDAPRQQCNAAASIRPAARAPASVSTQPLHRALTPTH